MMQMRARSRQPTSAHGAALLLVLWLVLLLAGLVAGYEDGVIKLSVDKAAIAALPAL